MIQGSPHVMKDKATFVCNYFYGSSQAARAETHQRLVPIEQKECLQRNTSRDSKLS